MKDKIMKITGYRTPDGKTFDNYSDAFDHVQEIIFKEWYHKDVVTNSEEDVAIYNDNIIAWLRRNRNRIFDFLGERDPEEKKDEQ